MGAPGTDLVSRLREVLASVADPGRAGPMQAYLRSAMPCRGVSAPALRAAIRPALRSHPLPDEETWRTAVLELWDGAEFREERYVAIELAKHRLYREHQQVPVLELYEHLIRTGAWWDLVDETAGHLVRDLLLAHRDEVSAVMRRWAVADDLWLRRSAVICQLGVRERCDQALLSHVIEQNLDGSTRTTPAESPYGREFFVRKAIGWALRDHARTDPEWVRDFVATHDGALAGLSKREALKHVPAGRLSGSRPQP